MKKIQITKENLYKLQDIVIFILLFLWMAMPIFQSLKITYKIIYLTKWYFILMDVTGTIGVILGTLNIYDKIKNAENKKQAIKEILPIFIFVLFMIWTLISAHQAVIKKQAFEGSSYRREGYYMYINYAGYFLCAFLLKSKKLRKILLNTFIVTAIFLITASRIVLVNKELLNVFTHTNIGGTVFQQFNHYGYYLLMALICSLGLFMTEKNKICKIIYLIAYTIIGYASIYNNTFGCYLAIAIFLVLYAIYTLIKKTDRIHIAIAIVIFVILSCVTTKNDINLASKNINEFRNDIKSVINKIKSLEDKKEEPKETTTEIKTEEQKKQEAKQKEIDILFERAGSERMKIWKYALEFIKEKPIFGYGPDNLKMPYLRKNVDQDRPHNLFLHLATISGIPGMIIYVTAVGIIVFKGLKRLFIGNKEGAIYLIIVITYLISSMFGNSMYYTSPYFFIFLGSLMHFNLQKQEE